MVTTSIKQMVRSNVGVIDRAIYSDPDIYAQELEQVFGRSWLYVAHASQLSKPNDFMANYMAEDPILVTKDARGKLHTFLNMCRHRGNRICRADYGNAPSFMCTYHGWTFSTDGKLVGVPGYKEAYFEELDRSQWGLVEAHTDSYKGLVFANWDKEAPGLPEFLGDAAWYLDIWLDRRENKTEVLGGMHRWVMPFNWKFGVDNFGGDTYHTMVSHGSMSLAGFSQGQRQPISTDKSRFQVAIGNGHCFIGGVDPEMQKQPQGSTFNKETAQYIRDINAEQTARLGKVRGAHTMGVGSLFPNFSWIAAPFVRNWHPRGTSKTEMWSWCIVDKDAPQEIKNAMRVELTQRFGPSASMEQDDANNWMGSTETSRSLTGKKYPLNMQMGLGRQWTSEIHPAKALNIPWSDTNWLHFYEHWAKMMDAPSWAQIQLDPIKHKQ